MAQKTDSKYLLSEHPINVYPTLARALGSSDRAIVLQQIRFWIKINSQDPSKQPTHFIDGRWWTYNTFEEWQKTFCWLSLSTIKRIFKWLEDEKLIIQEHFHRDPRNRTAWYTVNFDAVDRYCDRSNADVERKCQSDTMESSRLTLCKESDRHDDLYTETTDEVSSKRLQNHQIKQTKTSQKPPLAASKSRNANSAKGADRACACDDSFLKDDKATIDVEEFEQQEEQFTPGLNQTDNAEKRISNNFGKRGNVPRHSTTKKKSTKPEFDKDGYWNIPLSGKSDLAGRLTIQTMQLLILAETEDVEWYQERGMVWIREPKDGYGFREPEMLIKEAPLGRMKTFNEYGNEGCCCYSFCKDWFNGEAPEWLDYWRSQIEDHGKSAVSRQTKSLALYLYDLRDEKGKRTLDIKWQSADEVDWVDFEDVA